MVVFESSSVGFKIILLSLLVVLQSNLKVQTSDIPNLIKTRVDMKEDVFVGLPIEMGYFYKDPVPEIISFRVDKKNNYVVFYLKESKHQKDANKYSVYTARGSRNHPDFALINKIKDSCQIGDSIHLSMKKNHSFVIIDNSSNQGFCYTFER